MKTCRSGGSFKFSRFPDTIEMNISLIMDIRRVTNEVNFNNLVKLATVLSKDDTLEVMYPTNTIPDKVYLCELVDKNEKLTELMTRYCSDRIEVYAENNVDDLKYMKDLIGQLFISTDGSNNYHIKYHI